MIDAHPLPHQLCLPLQQQGFHRARDPPRLREWGMERGHSSRSPPLSCACAGVVVPSRGSPIGAPYYSGVSGPGSGLSCSACCHSPPLPYALAAHLSPLASKCSQGSASILECLLPCSCSDTALHLHDLWWKSSVSWPSTDQLRLNRSAQGPSARKDITTRSHLKSAMAPALGNP